MSDLFEMMEHARAKQDTTKEEILNPEAWVLVQTTCLHNHITPHQVQELLLGFIAANSTKPDPNQLDLFNRLSSTEKDLFG